MTDYQRVATAIAYLQQHFREQPSLEQVARQVHLSPFHFQRLFSRWAGVTPKKFLESLTLDAAKAELKTGPASLLEISENLGLSSGSRLHEHFVKLEAVTPAEFRAGGHGMTIHYGMADSPFGEAWLASTPRGICQLWFADHLGVDGFVDDLRKSWPQAELQRDDALAAQYLGLVFALGRAPDRPLSLLVRGTNFQIRVWQALLRIPFGQLSSYTAVAGAVGSPRAVRAVGSAVGANPVAFLIPCHRVIRQDGSLGGYRGGLERKQVMLAWERLRSAG